MSLQICYCGWSKVTTYHGLRTHQGKMGCTPKGMSIPKPEQFGYGSYFPQITYMCPPIKLQEPKVDRLTTSWGSDSSSDTSLQICYCGWSKVTTYHGLRTHQGMMGCTPKGTSIPKTEQITFNSYLPQITYTTPPIKLEEPEVDSLTTSWKSDSSSDMSFQVGGWSAHTSSQDLKIHQMGSTQKEASIPESEEYMWRDLWKESHQKDSRPVTSTPLKEEDGPVSPNLFTQINLTDSLVENQIHPVKTGANLDRIHQALDFNTGFQPLSMPVSQTLTTQVHPAAADATAKEANKPLFETPQRSHETAANSDKARRALDFSTGSQQVDEVIWGPPTTTAQEIAVCPKEKEREKEREAQKLLKATQDLRRAEMQQKIHIRKHKMAEIRSSVKGCKGSLDAEWLEINSAFSEVMKVVEDAWRKALQPLEERRRKVKSEAQDLVQKLEREVDKLKKSLDELDNNPDLQVSLDESRDWKNVSVDTSFSFGSLRATTSTMMEQIRLKLEKLSSVELKRITTFAVDVKLDPNTAHQCLVLSDDGKMVRDGGKNQTLPDIPQRFDMFGSVLGLDPLTRGKSYWEVEVSNKTGWDLGVARGDANRKGKLSLNPDSGYWVTVHYEGKRYAALTAPPVCLRLEEKPQKVGVFVDYEEGLVSFYDATARSHIYSFTECSFGGEVVPYFSPHLAHNGKNSRPLIISAVKRQ